MENIEAIRISGPALEVLRSGLRGDAYVPGVLLALERAADLPPGVTVGLETLVD